MRSWSGVGQAERREECAARWHARNDMGSAHMCVRMARVRVVMVVMVGLRAVAQRSRSLREPGERPSESEHGLRDRVPHAGDLAPHRL
jgi:hypothetical protein